MTRNSSCSGFQGHDDDYDDADADDDDVDDDDDDDDKDDDDDFEDKLVGIAAAPVPKVATH